MTEKDWKHYQTSYAPNNSAESSLQLFEDLPHKRHGMLKYSPSRPADVALS